MSGRGCHSKSSFKLGDVGPMVRVVRVEYRSLRYKSMAKFANFVGSTNGMVSRVEHFEFKNRHLFSHRPQLTREAHDRCVSSEV